MKERKTFIGKVKQLYSQHKTTVLVIIVIALFISGYFVSWNFLVKPMSDTQFELCEQVARDVYDAQGQIIIEVPKDFSVSMTVTTITVKSADSLCRGKVVAELRNGELVITQDLETGDAIFLSIVMGIMLAVVSILIFRIVYDFTKELKSSPNQ